MPGHNVTMITSVSTVRKHADAAGFTGRFDRSQPRREFIAAPAAPSNPSNCLPNRLWWPHVTDGCLRDPQDEANAWHYNNQTEKCFVLIPGWRWRWGLGVDCAAQVDAGERLVSVFSWRGS